MKIVWVKGSAILSKAIMWSLDEPVSHLAIVFDNKIVFHSALNGVHISWYKSFEKTHEVIHELDFSGSTLDIQEGVYQDIITAYDGKSYDYLGFLYFAWRALLLKFFNKPLPLKNPYSKPGSFLCTEIAGVLPDWIIPADIKANNDLSITSPEKLWKLLNPQK